MNPLTRRAARSAAALAAATAVLLPLTACGSAAGDTAAGEDTVVVRIPDPKNAGVLALGKKDGSLGKALAKAGARVEWTGSTGPFAPAAQALNADQLDIATGSITSGVTALTQKPGFKLFGATTPDGAGEGILVRKDSGIGSVKDLAGRKVAVNRGGTGEYLLLKALARHGVPADKVERVYLRPDQTASVYKTGQVDAWASWAAYSVAELGSGDSRFVADGAAVGSDNYSFHAVRTGFAEKHPKVVKALYDYLRTGSAAQKAAPEKYVNVFTDRGPTAVTGAARELQLRILREGGTVEPIAADDITRFESVARFYLDQKVLSKPVDIKPHILDAEALG
ncbi:NrtA/SsuA/CpmA family ABC transporter substrate-binding protein [Streptomyces albipurpureus]|uniref:NrtA/SsuA/CpmA family ABC transporter substrate-binding protein n=1 Tax=Streptomyces albipurpureus TaxID=2897419 RepID=A0ABT0UZI6_9ACTN|nr:NrtA/SsuA/CpmA family ABC transporter substrate-binding protein [Streptomyces sp. CWNU-1]MCM2393681.1 NrtA/SsuA/CpmA family ABC transporter substrate-binding protein [Streptomyces sp. CWNU-1]